MPIISEERGIRKLLPLWLSSPTDEIQRYIISHNLIKGNVK
jgi:hypothetical protein